MKKTYQGSCHCGAVRYAVDLDLDTGTGRCNCSICTKNRWWSAIVKPDDFRLLSGKEALSDYLFAAKAVHHTFCRHCGVHSFEHGHVAEIGGDYVAINPACLDDVAPEELLAAPLRYLDGKQDAWLSVPAETRHL